MMRNRFSPQIKNSFSIVFFAFSTLACFSLSSTSGFATPSKIDPSINDTSTMTLSPSESLPQLNNFSLENTNKIPPENVFDEISYFSSGGAYEPPECPYLDTNGPTLGFLFQNHKTILNDESGKTTIKTCGWELGETVTVTVRQPGGSVRNDELIVTQQMISWKPDYQGPLGIVYYDFAPTLGEFGKYSITFSGRSGLMRHSVFVSSSRVKELSDYSSDQFSWQGLVPNEKIRIYVYESIPACENCMGEGRHHFVAWDEYTADRNGEFVVDIRISPSESAVDINFAVFAEKSGVLLGPFAMKINPDGSCVVDAWRSETEIPARLELGDFAYVTFTPSQSIALQKDPGKSHESANRVLSGEVVEIIGGPQCIDSINWWKVEDRLGNFEGWVMEGQGEYFLVPCSKKNQACLLQ